MILATMLVCALAQEAASAKTPDPALFAELVRSSNALHAFVVEYQVTKGGEDAPGTVRILYRAPDRATIVLGDRAVFCLQGGVVDIRTSGTGEKPMTAHVPIAQANHDRFERIATVLRAEFPDCKDEWTASDDEGIRFDLVVQGGAAPSEKSLQFTASTSAKGSALFGWLETLSKKPCVSADPDRLVFEEPDGTKITLSTRTGFIEKVEKPRPEGTSTFRIGSLDLSPKLDDSAFELPPPDADAVDASASWAEGMGKIQTQSLRRRALASFSKLVAEKKVEWGPETRGKLAKVLEAIHASAWTLENGVWVADMRVRMTEFAKWFGDRIRDPAVAGAQARQKIEESVVEWRKRLLDSAGSGLEPRLSSLSIGADGIADEAVRRDVSDLEREVVKKTLQSELVEPLLRAFDEKIEEARRGK